MPNPFDWDYLTTPPASSEVFDVFTIVYLALFLGGFVASAYVYYRPWVQPLGRVFRRKAVMKATGIAMWVFGIGLFFFLIRLLQINPISFGEPIWMWLSVLGLLAMLVWIGVRWSDAKKSAPSTAGNVRLHARRSAPQTTASKRPVRRKSTLR
jgi:hypothetical protein